MTTASAAGAQSTADLLGVIPDGALVGGQANIAVLLDIDRLEVLMNSWGAVLGEEADALVAQMRDQYHESLGSLAEHVHSCVMYAASFEDTGPVTVCAGTFGEGGYTPPDVPELEIVEGGYLATGLNRAEAVAALRAGPTGGATVGGVDIDPSLLAHLVVTFPPDLAAGVDIPIPMDALRYIEIRVSDDPTQLGGMALQMRVSTSSPEMAQTIQALLSVMVDEVGLDAEQLSAAGTSAEELRGLVQIEGSDVVFRPDSELLATISAVALPAFLLNRD
jgi:hypothetical protein